MAVFDPHTVLGIARDASPVEIRQAYRRAAIEHKDGLLKNNPDAIAYMQDANRARDVLLPRPCQELERESAQAARERVERHAAETKAREARLEEEKQQAREREQRETAAREAAYKAAAEAKARAARLRQNAISGKQTSINDVLNEIFLSSGTLDDSYKKDSDLFQKAAFQKAEDAFLRDLKRPGFNQNHYISEGLNCNWVFNC